MDSSSRDFASSTSARVTVSTSASGEEFRDHPRAIKSTRRRSDGARVGRRRPPAAVRVPGVSGTESRSDGARPCRRPTWPPPDRIQTPAPRRNDEASIGHAGPTSPATMIASMSATWMMVHPSPRGPEGESACGQAPIPLEVCRTRVLGLPAEPHLRRATDRLRGGSNAAGGARRDAAGDRAVVAQAACGSGFQRLQRMPICITEPTTAVRKPMTGTVIAPPTTAKRRSSEMVSSAGSYNQMT